MYPVGGVPRRLPSLVWACLLLGALVRGGAAPSVTTDINSDGQRYDAIASGDLGDTHDSRATLTAVAHHIDDGPANDADTLDPAGPPPPALALTSPARAAAQLSVSVWCTVATLPSFRIVGPLGSRPPPFSF